jgi:ankyrin repeat protein
MKRLTDKQLLNSMALAIEKGSYQAFIDLVPPSRINDLILGQTALSLFVAESGPGRLAKGNSTVHTERDKVVDRLLRLGAKIDLSGRAGLTALHWATLTCDADMVKLLLDRGASMRKTSEKSKETAIQMTCPRASVHHGYFLISKLFMLHGAKPSEFETRRPGGAQNYYPSPESTQVYHLSHRDSQEVSSFEIHREGRCDRNRACHLSNSWRSGLEPNSSLSVKSN